MIQTLGQQQQQQAMMPCHNWEEKWKTIFIRSGQSVSCPAYFFHSKNDKDGCKNNLLFTTWAINIYAVCLTLTTCGVVLIQIFLNGEKLRNKCQISTYKEEMLELGTNGGGKSFLKQYKVAKDNGEKYENGQSRAKKRKREIETESIVCGLHCQNCMARCTNVRSRVPYTLQHAPDREFFLRLCRALIPKDRQTDRHAYSRGSMFVLQRLT